jgi:hypothetical protein
VKSIAKKTCIALCVAAAAGSALAQETTYRKDIRPIIEQKCMGCHGPASPSLAEFKLDEKKYVATSRGPRVDSYEHLVSLVGWPDTGAIMRRLDDGKNPLAGGKPGNMYQYLGATDEERQKNLQTFKAWVGKDAWVLNRLKARGNVPGISKEALEKIEVKY